MTPICEKPLISHGSNDEIPIDLFVDQLENNREQIVSDDLVKLKHLQSSVRIRRRLKSTQNVGKRANWLSSVPVELRNLQKSGELRLRVNDQLPSGRLKPALQELQRSDLSSLLGLGLNEIPNTRNSINIDKYLHNRVEDSEAAKSRFYQNDGARRSGLQTTKFDRGSEAMSAIVRDSAATGSETKVGSISHQRLRTTLGKPRAKKSMDCGRYGTQASDAFFTVTESADTQSRPYPKISSTNFVVTPAGGLRRKPNLVSELLLSSKVHQ